MSLQQVIGGFVDVRTSSGGSAPISTPQVAYITSDGSDSTGDGSINKPWRTVQKAADEEFYYWHLGANFNAGNVDFGGTELVTLYIVGEGYPSVIGTMTNHGFQIQVYDLGVQSFSIANVNTSAPGGVGNGAPILLTNTLVLGALNSSGGTGTPGGSGGTITLNGYGVVVGDINTSGGNADGGSNNDGGSAGDINISHSFQVNGNLNAAGGAGDGGGMFGPNGNVTIEQAVVSGTITSGSTTVRGAVIANVFYADTYP